MSDGKISLTSTILPTIAWELREAGERALTLSMDGRLVQGSAFYASKDANLTLGDIERIVLMTQKVERETLLRTLQALAKSGHTLSDAMAKLAGPSRE